LLHAPLPLYAVAVPFALPRKRAFGTDETVKLVVEALIAVIAVVEANGRMLAVVEVDVMLPAMN
jgi:hypothetical protein